MSDQPVNRELRPRNIAIETVAGLVLLGISVALGDYAFKLHSSGKSFQAVELFGVAICCLGGCFDPVNWIWMCLPFTKNRISESGRLAGLGWVIIGLGWMVLVVGMIGKYAHP